MRDKSNVIKSNVEKDWGGRYTLGARYLPKNMVSPFPLARVTITSVGILSCTTDPSSTAAAFASLSTNSFLSIPECPFTHPNAL
jgi:hypothetical protein